MARFSQADLVELESLLDELDRLSSEGEDDLAPMVSEADGFLAALVVSPEVVPQDEWLEVLFSGTLQLLPEESTARLVELLLARKAVIAGQLLQGRLAFEPVYEVDSRNDDVLWEFWIGGFDRAMQLRHPSWIALLQSDDAALVQAMTDLAMLVGMGRGAKLDPGEHEQTVADAPDMIPFLAEIAYCRQRGLPTLALDPEPQQPIRVQRVGRDEPCPCGSGKKYKKCCGR